MRIALDTNVLAYAEGLERSPDDAPKIELARTIIRRLSLHSERPTVPVQAMAELHSVLLRKGRLSREESSTRLRRLMVVCEVVGATAVEFEAALDLAADHAVPIFDAVILASASAARCDFVLSEDFQDGFAWRGVVVVNPFGPSPDPRLARLLMANG